MNCAYHETRQPFGVEAITRREAACILQNWRANPRSYQVARTGKRQYIAINISRDCAIETLTIGVKVA